MHRWNYMLAQTQSVLELEKPIKLYLLELNNPNLTLVPQQWEALYFILPVLECFNKITMLLQSDEPRKHMVFPAYHAISQILQQAKARIPSNWGLDGPGLPQGSSSGHHMTSWPWAIACEMAKKKLDKYINKESRNHQTLVAAILDPAYRQHIFEACHLPDLVAQEAQVALLNAYKNQQLFERSNAPPSTNQMTKNFGTYSHRGVIAEVYAALGPITAIQGPSDSAATSFDEVQSYLAGLNPVAPNESIIGYWKVCRTHTC